MCLKRKHLYQNTTNFVLKLMDFAASRGSRPSRRTARWVCNTKTDGSATANDDFSLENHDLCDRIRGRNRTNIWRRGRGRGNHALIRQQVSVSGIVPRDRKRSNSERLLCVLRGKRGWGECVCLFLLVFSNSCTTVLLLLYNCFSG